eukprot:CAMPEP_0114226618 /NCGR_PEP_ID=MMETSP0058-20121206/1332_1 /TAXON_ID=36894 /ORGANISM="Pyramimonas parkeae, CCMP726" /LENGTH=77 /DNA_ID=CAMNT_0001337363 /DNA_START=982 /DNA_END=1216 /DNA_ORIENTATION=-
MTPARSTRAPGALEANREHFEIAHILPPARLAPLREAVSMQLSSASLGNPDRMCKESTLQLTTYRTSPALCNATNAM